MKRLPIFAAVAVVALTLTASSASAKPGNGTPFQQLWDEIDEVRAEVAAISGVIEDPDALIDSFFDVFVTIDDHEDDVDALQAQIDDLRDELEDLQTTCADCCSPACESTDEVCDGADNDCDGSVDETFPEDGNACNTGLHGICSNGVMICSEGGLQCEPLNSPLAEVCNGIDDDCDGSVDEGLACEGGCIDLADPDTFGDDITYDAGYGTFYLRDDVRLCPDTYDMAGKSIRMYHRSGAGMLDCDGATLVGGGKTPGASSAIFAGCNSNVPTEVCDTDITIQGCVIENFNVGINARSADRMTVRNNVLRDLNYGIGLMGVSDGTVAGNTIENMVYTGISLDDSPMFPYQASERNAVTGNSVSSCGHYGISLFHSHDSEIRRNIVTGSGLYGIHLSESGGNLIYDNSFTNVHNAYNLSAGLHNAWNATPAAGTNILGGGMTGGNHWSDYSGIDTTGDGIGDTDLPYTSGGGIQGGDGDSAPLVP